jgi:hypothetical protein
VRKLMCSEDLHAQDRAAGLERTNSCILFRKSVELQQGSTGALLPRCGFICIAGRLILACRAGAFQHFSAHHQPYREMIEQHSLSVGLMIWLAGAGNSTNFAAGRKIAAWGGP